MSSSGVDARPHPPERVLNLLSTILAGEPFTQAGAPHKAVRHDASAHPTEHQDPATIELALEILGSFNFKGIFQLHKSSASGPFRL
jgi:FKBP12-rapamycin complex-associated protein